MKADLDRLMAARALEALLVVGDGHVNTLRAYLSNGAHVSGGYILKVRGHDPVMIVNGMETDEAAKSGLHVLSFYDLGYAEIVKAVNGDSGKATVALIGAILARFDVPHGKIGLYGEGAIHRFIETAARLNDTYPAYQFVGESGATLFDEAMQTKDSAELLRMRSVGARTSQVLRLTWDFIAAHRAEGEQVVTVEGTPLTIGAVKRFVRRALLDHDLEDTDMIFAQGRDAGMPHSRGEADQVLKVGEAIVFDLFPREIGGGYHHDCTRTWSIHHASPEVAGTHALVLDAFELAVDSFRVNMPAKALQEAVLDHFEAHGHPTGRSHPGTVEGYVHSLGHGLGLEIHENPRLSHLSSDTLAVGNVISIEPGLYYPEKGYGVRIEDTFAITETGELVALTDFPHDLILPLRGGRS
ncbi:MAG: Xaa-Pro peptidase family protein [bacterium]|nr:Xaa-Pro peptidase family protein [bacterium]